MSVAFDKTVFFSVVKVLVILIPADVASVLVPRHPNIAYSMGLLLGAVLQIAIPPRVNWKKQFMWVFAVVIVASFIHPLIRK